MPVRNKLWTKLDWITILLFALLVLFGWINIYASVFNEETSSVFDFSQRHGKQLIFILAAAVIGLTILFIETDFYVFFAYIIYAVLISLLLLVLFAGTEINGSRSWFVIGDFSIQPSEFCKFATALALSKYMSSYGFRLNRFTSALVILLIIMLPVSFILLQNDTGSALVYFSFILVLYREGLSGLVLFFGFLLLALFILVLVIPYTTLGIILLSVLMVAFLIFQTRIKQFFHVLAIFAMAMMIMLIIRNLTGNFFDLGTGLAAASIVAGISTIFYTKKNKLKNFGFVVLVFTGAVIFTLFVEYAFNEMLEPHHQARINELLGIASDPLGAGYNVNQSKIAIGSGGFWGKGFLNGTQTKFNFVPEQTTDFIFCTVGEEWGFIGAAFLVGLFLLLFVRLIFLAERQRSGFSRIYGYSTAVILFFHFAVNVGMTIGLMPVIGIPLPFFSYGGSSLWAFTILLFVFIRLDASRLDHLSE